MNLRFEVVQPETWQRLLVLNVPRFNCQHYIKSGRGGTHLLSQSLDI